MAHGSPAPLTAAGSPDTILVAASYQIPLLWLSLFSESDLKTVEIVLEDAEGNETTGGVPTLEGATEILQTRYQVRARTLLARIPAELHPHIKEWETLLVSVKEPFMQIDLAEIWMMFMPDDLDHVIRGELRAFEEGGELWRNVCNQAGLEVDTASGRISFDPAIARYGLRGYEWYVPVPWSD